MKRKWFLMLAGSIAFSVSAAFGQGVIDPAAELVAMKAAVQAGDFPGALHHTAAIERYAIAQPWPPESSKPWDYRLQPADTALTIAARLGDALQAGDMYNFKKLASVLSRALNRDFPPTKPNTVGKLAQLQTNADGAGGAARFMQLPMLAEAAFDAGETAQASAYASELLAAASGYPVSLQGNAVFHGNLVLGKVALKSGDTTAAGAYLLAAGKTSGSATLNSFGPGMALASGLLAQGQSEVVLEYLAECKNFWQTGASKLTEWTLAIRQGKAPDFGPNLSR